MGDSGSLLLGMLLAVASIEGVLKSSITVALAIPLLSLLIPVYDLFFSIIRRLLKGKHIFTPDKGHVHHRLLNLGYNQSQAVVRIYYGTIVFNIIALLMVFTNMIIPFIVFILAVIVVVFMIVKSRNINY